MPAAPASEPASRNVTEIVRLTSMPIIAEASVSWATARIALPCFVERTNQERHDEQRDHDDQHRGLAPGVR